MHPPSPRTSHWNPTLCQVALIAVRSQLRWTAWPKTTIRWQLGYRSKYGCQGHVSTWYQMLHCKSLHCSCLFRGLGRWHAYQRSIWVNFTYSHEWTTWVLTCLTDAARFSKCAQIASEKHGSPLLANTIRATQQIRAESVFCRGNVL